VGAGVGRGLGGGASAIACLICSSTPEVAFLNSRSALPTPRANSGIFSPPKSISTTRKISIISPPPTSPMNANVGQVKNMGSGVVKSGREVEKTSGYFTAISTTKLCDWPG
jgi:hypothetical protein